MEPTSTSMDFNGGEEVKLPTITENSAGEAEQEANLETTINTGPSYSIYLAREKRRRDSDSSSDDDLDFLDDDEEEEDNKGKKRIMTEEEKLASHQEWYESQLEENKQNLLKEMREKENKLMMMKWSDKRKESCASYTSVERLKEELALLQIMYEQLVI